MFDKIYFRTSGTGNFSYFQIENALTAIYLETTTINLSNGEISNCETGVYLNSSNLTVSNVDFTNNTNYGIHAQNNEPELTIEDCSISNQSRYYIY